MLVKHVEKIDKAYNICYSIWFANFRMIKGYFIVKTSLLRF